MDSSTWRLVVMSVLKCFQCQGLDGWTDGQTDRSTFGLVTCYIFNVRGHFWFESGCGDDGGDVGGVGVFEFQF